MTAPIGRRLRTRICLPTRTRRASPPCGSRYGFDAYGSKHVRSTSVVPVNVPEPRIGSLNQRVGTEGLVQ